MYTQPLLSGHCVWYSTGSYYPSQCNAVKQQVIHKCDLLASPLMSHEVQALTDLRGVFPSQPINAL